MDQAADGVNRDLQFYKVYEERKAVLDNCGQTMLGAMAALDREILLCSQSLQQTRMKWDELERKSLFPFEIDSSSILSAGITDFAGKA